MPLTDRDIRALVHLAVACRPQGAPRWDEGGIFANIAKVRGWRLADVALAVIRAADDANAKTPGVISNTSAPNWQERSTVRVVPREPYEPGSFCHICNQPEQRCRRNEHSGHEFESATDLARRLTHDPRRKEKQA